MQEDAGKGSDEEGLAQGNRALPDPRTGKLQQGPGNRREHCREGVMVLKSRSAEGFGWASDADRSKLCGEDVCPREKMADRAAGAHGLLKDVCISSHVQSRSQWTALQWHREEGMTRQRPERWVIQTLSRDCKTTR